METKTKVKGPTLRQRMVKGTTWKLTQPAQVVKAKAVLMPYGHGQDGHYTDYVSAPDYILPSGTEITVTGKFQTYGPQWIAGNWVPVSIAGRPETLIEFRELNKNPEQIGEVEAIPMFAIWDTKEQKYYTGHDYGYIEYSDKLSKAKKFKRLADVRVHALIQSGYYYDLPETWGSVPDWMQDIRGFDIPDTWEIVKYDKLSKKEIERIELVDTFKRSWSLRELTVKYSSSVRKVYSDLEKKKKLGEWSAIMMFKKKSKDESFYWTDELSTEEIADINKLLGRFGNEVKIQKGVSGFAVAIKDARVAIMVQLAYEGNLESVIIDFESMKEIVK